MDKPTCSLRWIGSDEPHLNGPFVCSPGRVHIGVYGGNTNAGAYKNEDGALAWFDDNGVWEFAMIIDGHNSSESVRLLVDEVETHQSEIEAILWQPVSQMFNHLQQYVVDLLASVQTTSVRGESSCLVVARKDCYLWWMNVGDSVLYLFHPDYAKFGQYAVNQRSFFEWIGEVNSFSEPVPCYATGIKRLREGRNVILAVTDGVLEFGNRPFQDPKALYESVYTTDASLEATVADILELVQSQQGADSATVIGWNYNCQKEGPFPSS